MTLITLDGGIKIMTFKPPAGFNPLTASPDDVIKNGFPARPEDPHSDLGDTAGILGFRPGVSHFCGRQSQGFTWV